MVSFHLIFHACLELRFPDVETNPGTRRPVPGACLSKNLAGLFQEPERCDSGFASVWFVVVLWDPGLEQASYISVAGSWIWSSCLVVPGWNAAGSPWDGCMCARWIWGISPSQIWVWLLWLFRVCGATQNFYVYSLYRNPDLDGRIYDCLPTAMAAVQAADARASLLLNGHVPLEWPSSGMVRFYYHEPSWCCGPRFCHCVRLWSTGDWPNSCTWRNSWPPDDRCFCPSTGGCYSTTR